MDSSFRDKIILRMSPLDFSANPSHWPTEGDWDNYFSNYGNAKFLNESDDFLSYEDMGDTILIKDFIADEPANALSLWKQLEEKAKGKRIMGYIHTANYKLLNTAIRQGFQIVDFNGTQYLVERR